MVISRRAAGPSSDHTPTEDGDTPTTKAALTAANNQVVVNATIPAKVAPGSFAPPQQPEVDAAARSADEAANSRPTERSIQEESPQNLQDSSNSSASDAHVSVAEVGRTSAAGFRPKRKSLESVIKSLQPTPVATVRCQPEVARSRPEVLVRPMQAYAAQSNPLPAPAETVGTIGHFAGGRISAPYGQPEPEAVDLRRAKLQTPTARRCMVVGRRKPKSLSPLQAPPVVDDPYSSSVKRRRFTTGAESAAAAATWSTSSRFGCYFPPSTAGVYGSGQAAVAAAARYHACMAAARPDVARLPVYYGGGALQSRAEPNGYDAPLELTTKRPRDRK